MPRGMAKRGACGRRRSTMSSAIQPISVSAKSACATPIENWIAINDQHQADVADAFATRRSADRGRVSVIGSSGRADQGGKPVGDALPAGRRGRRAVRSPDSPAIGRPPPPASCPTSASSQARARARGKNTAVGPVMIDPWRGFLDGSARLEHHAVGELLDREVARRRTHAVEHLGDLVEHRPAWIAGSRRHRRSTSPSAGPA